MEWRLFAEGTVPEFTQRPFFASHHWVPPAGQTGHAERIAMVADLVRRFVAVRNIWSLVDLGCGDGSLLLALQGLPVAKWGYDVGTENLNVAWSHGLDVRLADILVDPLEYGDLIVATEVLEHLLDPHGFLRQLPGDKLIVSSPSAETDEWHYAHHAWAWDLEGYVELLTSCGWRVIEHVECAGGDNVHGGHVRAQRFQGAVAVR